MTVRTPPTFLQAGSHTAENTRLALQGFWGSATGSFAGGVSAVDAAHGVVRAESTQLQVTQNGTPNMSVNVAAGACFIRGTESATQGCYHFAVDATVNLSIDASDPTNARRDLIVAQVRDSGYSGSDNDARLFVVKGTAAGSPADPTVPANCLVLARVQVNAGATTITTANITDLRTYARPWNAAWGQVASATRTSEQTFNSTSFVDATGLSVTFTAVAGRRYKIEAYFDAIQVSNTGYTAQIVLTDGSNTPLQRCSQNIGSSLQEFHMNLLHYTTPSAGSVTYKLRGRVNVGAGPSWKTAAASERPAWLVVEDIGPA